MGTKIAVEVIKEGLEIRPRFQMVHVVLGSSTEKTERKPIVNGEREVKTVMSLDANKNTDDHVAPGGQAVAFEEPGVSRD